MKIKRPQYQQGSIRRVSKSGGFARQVRFSDRVNGRRPADGIRTRMSFSIKITAISRIAVAGRQIARTTMEAGKGKDHRGLPVGEDAQKRCRPALRWD